MAFWSKKSPESSPSQEGEPIGKEITDAEAAEFAHDGDFDEGFVTSTSREERDAEGKLLKNGTTIIRNPESPDVLLGDSPETRRGFIQHGFSFKFVKEPYAPPEERANVLVEGDVKEYLKRAAKNAKDFLSKVKDVKHTTLSQETRDAEGKLLKSGREVIIDPVYEELVMEDTPKNRADFVKNGGTWRPDEAKIEKE